MSVKFGSAFKETMFRYDLVGDQLAADAGVTPNQVSNLKKGKNVRSDTLERILDAMPTDARGFFLKLIAGDDGCSCK